MRMLFVFVAGMLMMLAQGIPGMAAPAENFPDTIDLPNGFQPEGVVVGHGPTLYAGSLDKGAVYQADLRTGEGQVLVPPQTGRVAVGLSFDRRSNYLFVAGGGTGAAYVYDVGTGEDVADYQLTAPGTFVNDVVVTRSAAYFTDSFLPQLYRIPLGPRGQLPDSNDVETIPLSGDFVSVSGFNTNGIDATPNGKSLVIVNTSTGALYNVDPDTGSASLIDLDGETVPSGDGILLDDEILYVVQNFLNQIAVVELNDDLTAGEILGTITNPDFDIPTTIAEFDDALFAVNARFLTPPASDTPYSVVRVPKDQ